MTTHARKVWYYIYLDEIVLLSAFLNALCLAVTATTEQLCSPVGWTLDI